jgi:hypothetical protein
MGGRFEYKEEVTKYSADAEFLDIIGTTVLRVFLFAFHSHLS